MTRILAFSRLRQTLMIVVYNELVTSVHIKNFATLGIHNLQAHSTSFKLY